MITQELFEYIRKQVEAGVDKKRIKRKLLASGGWLQDEVDRAFEYIEAKHTAPAIPANETIPPVEQGIVIEHIQGSSAPSETGPKVFAYKKKRFNYRLFFQITACVLFVLLVAYGIREFRAFKKATTLPPHAFEKN